MSLSLDTSIRNLSACGCCGGLEPATPIRVENRPGLSTIAYRVGVYSQFRSTLLARLSGIREPALAALTARDGDDFSVALLDAWAAVCDILTFYQERIANEHYIATADELFSIIELARLIDYQFQPGVAASVDLAFTLEEAPGAFGQALGVGTSAQTVPSPPVRVTIDAGTKVLSVPGPGEQALTFETIQRVETRADWNAMKPRLRQPQPISVSTEALMLASASTNLAPGDWLLIRDGASNLVKRAIKVTPDNEARTTQVDFRTPPANFPPPYAPPADLTKGDVNSLAAKTTPTDQMVKTEIVAKTWVEEDLSVVIATQRWDELALLANVARQTQGQPANSGSAGVFAFRQRAAIFGHNAPLWKSLSANLRFGEKVKDQNGADISVPPAFSTNWDDTTPAAIGAGNKILLDNTYPGVTVGSYIALVIPSATPNAPLIQLCKVLENVAVSARDFAMSAKVSQLTVDLLQPVVNSSAFNMRTTQVLLVSEELPLADLPIPDDVANDTITLNGAVLGLKPGQRVVLTGQRTDLKNTFASESLTLKSVTVDGGFTVLTFQQALVYKYARATVAVNGNVAPATHGESVDEVLGDGDAGQAFQKFKLRQPPLSYVSAATPTGAQSTLEVRVNDLLWKETPSLFGCGPDERVYVTRSDATGNTRVVFGDSNTGARPATGAGNLRARYRKGVGVAGLLSAHRITQLLTRPFGLKGVTNPLPTEGAADPEKPDDIRQNAPLPVRTLGRIVSLKDYEDFARAFAGVAKSLGTWTWSGATRSAFLTIAGANGAAVEKTSRLYTNLLQAMAAAGDPTVPLAVESYTPRLFRLSAGLQVDPAFLPVKVVAAVTDALRAEFGFSARMLGQQIALSEVMTVIQHVPGIVAVDVNSFYRSDEPERRADFLPAAAPQAGADSPFGAELLTLDPRPLNLEVLP
jgi:predicted phage baseplate assembly protein